MKVVRAGRAEGRPAVTVVVPCYNYGRFLPALVDSALNQTDVDAHVIIVDDASPDGSGLVARQLAGQNPSRVRAILHTENRGHIATYNDGLDAVETEFATLISADDMLAPGSLGRAARLMNRFPAVGMVYGHASVFYSEPNPKRRPLPETWSVWNGHSWIELTARLGRNLIVSPEVVMRTQTIREIGGYSSTLPHSADLEYWLRAAARWDVGRVNGRSQAYYRMHGSNMHLTQFASMAVDLRLRFEAFETLGAPELRDFVPDGQELVARARGAIARQAVVMGARELDRGARADDVASLFELAEDFSPGASETRGVAWRLRRQQNGKTPAAAQRVIEQGRGQLDRVRGLLSEVAGIA